MKLISLIAKPKIASDSFKPKWIHKLYIKVIGKSAGILQGIYAMIKYDGDILQDEDIRTMLFALWANEETKQKARDLFTSAKRIKETFQEARNIK